MGGIVVMRNGVNTKTVIEPVKARIAQIQPGLPPGVTIMPFYDRSDLIDRTIDTLKQTSPRRSSSSRSRICFLFHFRSILIVTPAALGAGSFITMHYARFIVEHHVLAGIAIAIGVLVDAGHRGH